MASFLSKSDHWIKDSEPSSTVSSTVHQKTRKPAVDQQININQNLKPGTIYAHFLELKMTFQVSFMYGAILSFLLYIIKVALNRLKENLRQTLTTTSLIYEKYIFFVLKFHFFLGFLLFLMYANDMPQAIQS